MTGVSGVSHQAFLARTFVVRVRSSNRRAFCRRRSRLTGETIDGEGERVLGCLEISNDQSARRVDLFAATSRSMMSTALLGVWLSMNSQSTVITGAWVHAA